MPGFLDPLFGHPASPHRLINARTGAVLATHVLAAFDSASRRKGLLGHNAFPADSALVIAPSSAIHTFFMRFPIDVLFVARDGRIVKVRPRVVPWRMAGALGAHAVIELAAGAVDRADVRSGDRVVIELR